MPEGRKIKLPLLWRGRVVMAMGNPVETDQLVDYVNHIYKNEDERRSALTDILRVRLLLLKSNYVEGMMRKDRRLVY